MASVYELNLVTGAKGKNHITSADDGSLFASMYGKDKYVMNGFKYTLVNSGLIRIAEGDALINGRHCRINHGYVADLQLAAGSNGMNRIDLVVITYRKNSESDERATLEVLTGTATTGNAIRPSYASGNVLNGSSVVQFPLYQINYYGINSPIVLGLFTASKSMMEIREEIMKILIPPVGWIEYNENGLNPSNRYHGTKWELLGSGKFEVCVNTNDKDFAEGNEGGSKLIQLSVAQLPTHHHATKAHSHQLNTHTHVIPALSGKTEVSGAHSHKANYTQDAASGSAKNRYFPDGDIESNSNFIKSSGTHSHNLSTNRSKTETNIGDNGVTKNSTETNTTDTGSGADINILPPYITLYRWKRTK